MPPEAKARQLIDRRLSEAGWILKDYRDRNIHAALGVVIREFPTQSGPADFLMYVDGNPPRTNTDNSHQLLRRDALDLRRPHPAD